MSRKEDFVESLEQKDKDVGLSLRLRAAALLFKECLAHPLTTSIIYLDPEQNKLILERRPNKNG